jgi:hypothetical protein
MAASAFPTRILKPARRPLKISHLGASLRGESIVICWNRVGPTFALKGALSRYLFGVCKVRSPLVFCGTVRRYIF